MRPSTHPRRGPLVTLAQLLLTLGLVAASWPALAEKPVRPAVSLRQRLSGYEARIQQLVERYRADLGPFHDPFASATTVEHGDAIFGRLSRRERGGRTGPSSLALINRRLQKLVLGPQRFDGRMVERILADDESTLVDPRIERRDRQSNLLSLYMSLDYLERYQAEARAELDAQKEKATQAEQPQEDADGDSEKSPEHPTLPTKTQAKNEREDPSSGGGKPQKKTVLAETDFETPFFEQRIFPHVIRKDGRVFVQTTSLPLTPPPAKAHAVTGRTLTYNTLGAQVIELCLPSGCRPLQPSDPRAQINPLHLGSYELKLAPGVSQVHIPVEDTERVELTPQLRELYTRPVGVASHEWPELIQSRVLGRLQKDKHAPLQIAQQIANHIAGDYVFNVDGEEADFIDALRVGRLTCAMAAPAMVALVRDAYGLPARIMGGFRAKTKGGDAKSYLVTPDEPHLWVEVFDDGRWHRFDPTPHRAQKQPEAGGGGGPPEEYGDRHLENMPEHSPEDSPDDADSRDGATAKDGEPKSGTNPKPKQAGDVKALQADIEKATQARQKALAVNPPQDDAHAQRDAHEGGKSGDEPHRSEQPDSAQHDKAQQQHHENDPAAESSAKPAAELQLGSLTDHAGARNPLRERALRHLLRASLDPRQTGTQIAKTLDTLRLRQAQTPIPELHHAMDEAMSVHELEHPPLAGWIDEVRVQSGKRNVNETHAELVRLQASVDQYARLLDRDPRDRGLVDLLARLRGSLDKARKELDRMGRPEGLDIGLVDDLHRGLPGLAKTLLTRAPYALESVGANAATERIAHDLKSGKLADLRLLQLLAPLSNIILGGIPQPEHEEMKTWLRQPRIGADLMIVERPTDLLRAMRGQPGKSLEQNFREGTAWVRTRRKRMDQPTGRGKDDTRRETILLCDVSISMGLDKIQRHMGRDQNGKRLVQFEDRWNTAPTGNKARFVAALTRTMVAQALGDKAKSGRLRHHVRIITFDKVVALNRTIDNEAMALEVIGDRQGLIQTNSTKPGSRAEAAYVMALDMILAAQGQPGNPLAGANIVMMSDGEVAFDSAEIRQKQEAIRRKTPLQMAYVSIGDHHNEDLARHALASKPQRGVDGIFYKEFNLHAIETLLAESKKLDLAAAKAAGKDFFSDQPATRISSAFADELTRASRLADELKRALDAEVTPTLVTHMNELRQQKPKTSAKARSISAWLLELRPLLASPLFGASALRQRVVDDLMRNFDAITGVRRDALTAEEQGGLLPLLQGTGHGS